jgi:hypothetical protein
MLYDDCVLPSVFNRKLITARREHRCSECEHPIFKGEQYWNIRGLWEGTWDTFYICTCCENARCAVAGEIDVSCVPYGFLAEYIDYYGLEDKPATVEVCRFSALLSDQSNISSTGGGL